MKKWQARSRWMQNREGREGEGAPVDDDNHVRDRQEEPQRPTVAQEEQSAAASHTVPTAFVEVPTGTVEVPVMRPEAADA